MIFFVLCPSYHGATLLSALLNNHSEVLSLGDTNPTLTFDQGCSCGDKVSACAFWDHVRECTGWKADDGLPTLLPSYPYLSRSNTINKAAVTALALAGEKLGKTVWSAGGRPARRFHDTYGNFLRACRTWAPHKAFVDGEKSLLKFMTVASMGFPVKGVIHLTRDPRGYVNSALKYVKGATTEQLAMEWADHHRRIQRLVGMFGKIPSMTLRYEDLSDRPQAVMEEVFAFMGLDSQDVVCAPKDPKKHHMIGNKMLQSFDGTVQQDRIWETVFPTAEQDAVTKRLGNLLDEFGYAEGTSALRRTLR